MENPGFDPLDQCLQNEFKCKSDTPTKCIPEILVCNGQTDCDDMSDEMDCSNERALNRHRKDGSASPAKLIGLLQKCN